jgi:hypothetical protein
VKNFEYEGATGGQGVAKLLTDGLFAGARAMAESLDAFLGGFDTTTGVMQTALAKLITAFEIVSAPFIGADAAARLGAFAQNLEGAAQRTKSVDVSFVDLVDRAKKLYENATLAADGVAGLTKEVQSTPSKLQLLANSAEKAAPVVGNLEKAVPGLIGKMGELGGGFVDSVKKVGVWGQSLIDQANASRKIQEQYGSLADVGLVTTRELEKLSIAAAGTGAGADAAKERLSMLAKSGEMLTSVQDRLRNSMMSPIEQYANQRQSFLEQMGFNPFYVEEQKRLWLAKQQEAVDAQIKLAKEAYMKFKQRIGEGLGLTGPDGDSLLPDTEETLPELEKQTNLLGDVVDGIKGIWENVTLATIG